MLTREDVEKVAGLARLKLTEEEISEMADKLSQVISYVTVLDEVDVSNVEPMAHVADVANIFREDAVRESLPREAALDNAPKSDGKYFLVPQILENA
ncbi:MAG: Asp-tRNA(Asn)/Glu-tRNA(Gln) amidotransferase subunit GatC [Planctomycetota bacterium]|nr:Asp-tRNA(Asn)/Glu-tRNA(Gln) amidotransferase subunit GatC [Planctomycetota bacterium]MDA1248467.1 Asp-tRNA(Asn)/Glu-tRNA(Gln) amidotransferase subunit GatC [Planctomycetota bacterium]